MNAQEIVIAVIRNQVAMMNAVKYSASTETMERLRHELTGMMICLKNISSSDEFYNINYIDGGYEFGYYDKDGKWFSIEK